MDELLKRITYKGIPVTTPPLEEEDGSTDSGIFGIDEVSHLCDEDDGIRGIDEGESRLLDEDIPVDIPVDKSLHGVRTYEAALDKSTIGTSRFRPLLRQSSSRDSLTKSPGAIETLEDILSQAYQTKTVITDIRELPTTRKRVKVVHFRMHDRLHNVWIFKANPQQTSRELVVYNIAYEHDIPTGRPIGFVPEDASQEYPYDIAVIGGVVEHAGDPYPSLIKNMRLRPEYIHEMALHMTKVIASYQAKLTAAKEVFINRGIALEQANPSAEIQTRLLAALGYEQEKGSRLIKACIDLYAQQKGNMMVSHNDIHPGNIVTLTEGDGININRFGVIDWGSIALDGPLGDLEDFWLHHRRTAMEVCNGNYPFSTSSILDAYREGLAAHGLTISRDVAIHDRLIQSTLWNIYEMFDPTRTDPDRIDRLSQYHCGELTQKLKSIEMLGYQYISQAIRIETAALLAENQGALRIFQS